MRLIVRLLLAALLLFSTAQVFAQATATGTVRGTVTDASGAVVSGAQVTITNTGTSVTRTANSGATGAYVFDQLPPGSYSVKVTKAGFAAGVSRLELLVGLTATTNFALKPGSVDQVVEVTTAAPIIDTEKTSVAQQVTPSEVEELPMLGRDAANLAYLAPGVKQADSFDPTKNRSAVLSVNGNVGRDVNVTVNGIDNKDSTVGGTVMQLPLEAVEEFQISTQRFSAANGRSEGAAINMITKSGSNQFHGSAFGYFREQQFNADQTEPGGDKVNPPYSRQQFGGSIGGPIVKNKMFGFFAYERQREKTSLSEVPNSFNELSLLTSVPYGNSTVAPKPASTIPLPFYENRYNGRLDFKFNDKETAYVSVSAQSNNGLNDQSDGNGDLTGGNYTVNHMQVANFSLNSALSPTLVNAFTFGFQYWNNIIASNINQPYMTFASGEWFGTNVNVPQQSFQRKWQWKDDITKTIGKHTLKGGVDYLWNPKLGGFFEFNSTLEVDFGDDPSNILNPAKYPLGFATPGLVSGMTIANGDPTTNVPGGTKQLGFYFQDDWKVTKRLSLNLGLRWDRDFNLIGGSALPHSRTWEELVAINSPYASHLPHDDNKDFSPRIGFAYDLTGAGKHVLRGGFGLYYGNVFQNIPLFMEQMANATVFQSVFSLAAPTDVVPGTGIALANYKWGVDPLPTIAAPSSQLVADSVGRTMDPSYRNPYNVEFNFGYQWAISTNSVFEAEYVHTLGLHSNVDININPVDPNTGDRPLSAAFAAAGQPVLGRVMDNQSIGRTRYDGLNLSYRQRMVKNFSLIANYTLSRAMGYSIDSGGPPGQGSAYHNYPHDLAAPLSKSDFGPTPFDERHHVTVSGIVNLPWGFEVAPIMQIGSARPYDPNQGYDILGVGSGYSRPMVVLNSNPKDYRYYVKNDPSDPSTGPFASNSAAGAQARADLAAGLAHIVPYDYFRGDPTFELDARISKNIKFKERARLQLSFQAFDLTNRANYGNNFNFRATSSNFGTPNGFQNPTSTTIPRAFIGEFGARFTF